MEENKKNIDEMNKYREELEHCKCHLEEELKNAKFDNTLLERKVLDLETKEKK